MGNWKEGNSVELGKSITWGGFSGLVGPQLSSGCRKIVRQLGNTCMDSRGKELLATSSSDIFYPVGQRAVCPLICHSYLFTLFFSAWYCDLTSPCLSFLKKQDGFDELESEGFLGCYVLWLWNSARKDASGPERPLLQLGSFIKLMKNKTKQSSMKTLSAFTR